MVFVKNVAIIATGGAGSALTGAGLKVETAHDSSELIKVEPPFAHSSAQCVPLPLLHQSRPLDPHELNHAGRQGLLEILDGVVKFVPADLSCSIVVKLRVNMMQRLVEDLVLLLFFQAGHCLFGVAFLMPRFYPFDGGVIGQSRADAGKLLLVIAFSVTAR